MKIRKNDNQYNIDFWGELFKYRYNFKWSFNWCVFKLNDCEVEVNDDKWVEK